MRKICLILVGLITNVCLAQEIPVPSASIDPRPKTPQTYTDPEFTARGNKIADFGQDLNLRFIFDVPCPGNKYWNDYSRESSYHITLEYAGLQRVIYGQLERLANRYYKQQLSTYWDQTYLHPSELDRRMRQFNLENSDTYNHWWTRTWRESLPPEKGGQKSFTYQVGSRIELLQIGPLSVNNEGHFSWESWQVDVEDNKDVTLTDIDALRNRAIRDKYNLGIRSPEGQFASDWFQFRLGVKLNIRADSLSTENRSEIGLTFKLNLINRHGEREVPYMKIQGSAKFQPLTGAAEVQLQLNLAEF